MDRNFRAFIDFMSLELEVPTICLVTGGVSVRRDRRYCGYLSVGTTAYVRNRPIQTFVDFHVMFHAHPGCLVMRILAT
jgi:hypothetical protein